MANSTRLLGLLLLVSSPALAQRQPAPSRYLMLVREIEPSETTTNRRASLTVIDPDGGIKTEEIQVEAVVYSKKVVNASIARFTPDSTSNPARRLRYARNVLVQAEVKKVNELSAQGWQLISTTQESPSTTRYLFRKDVQAQ